MRDEKFGKESEMAEDIGERDLNGENFIKIYKNKIIPKL